MSGGLFWTMLSIIAIQGAAVAILSGVVSIFISARWHRFAYKDDLEAVKIQVDLNSRRLDQIAASMARVSEKQDSGTDIFGGRKSSQ